MDKNVKSMSIFTTVQSTLPSIKLLANLRHSCGVKNELCRDCLNCDFNLREGLVEKLLFVE